MSDAIDSLTDKERDALRLILRGHDAKSSARELGLSVHTINERLRTARRKLEVTSSKEAARRLLETEGGPHEKLTYQDLGEARDGASGKTGEVAAGRQARRILAGVMLMMTVFAAGLVLASQFAEPAPQGAPAEAPARDVAVVDAARNWLALTDKGDWLASYNAAGTSFRDLNAFDVWVGAAQKVRASQGDFVSRELLTVRYLNAPPRGYQEVVFSTRYAKADDPILETVTLQQEGGEWKVVGVMIH